MPITAVVPATRRVLRWYYGRQYDLTYSLLAHDHNKSDEKKLHSIQALQNLQAVWVNKERENAVAFNTHKQLWKEAEELMGSRNLLKEPKLLPTPHEHGVPSLQFMCAGLAVDVIKNGRCITCSGSLQMKTRDNMLMYVYTHLHEVDGNVLAHMTLDLVPTFHVLLCRLESRAAVERYLTHMNEHFPLYLQLEIKAYNTIQHDAFARTLARELCVLDKYGDLVALPEARPNCFGFKFYIQDHPDIVSFVVLDLSSTAEHALISHGYQHIIRAHSKFSFLWRRPDCCYKSHENIVIYTKEENPNLSPLFSIKMKRTAVGE